VGIVLHAHPALWRLLQPSILVAASAMSVIACGRSGLDLGDGPPALDVDADGLDSGADVEPDAFVGEDGMTTVPTPVPTTAPTMLPMPGPAPDPCANRPPVPCPGGGFQYCVAGSYSACPQRCNVCIPGSHRVCFLGYCNHWGTQTCTSDGMSFGYCQEDSPPSACDSLAKADHKSAALEQCCIDNGFCCADDFHLGGGPAGAQQVGRCGSVSCAP
jgi:hypothetical protein